MDTFHNLVAVVAWGSWEIQDGIFKIPLSSHFPIYQYVGPAVCECASGCRVHSGNVDLALSQKAIE